MKVRDIVREDAKITKSDGSGVEITADDGVKTTLPADKAAALMPDPDKPGEYDLNPQAVASSTGAQPTGPAVGANVEIKTAEDSGGDDLAPGKMTIPLDKFMQIADENNKENGFNVDLEKIKPMLVMTPSGEVDAGPTLQKMAGFFQGPEFTKFMDDMKKLIAFAEQNRPGPTKTAAAGNAPYNPLNKPEAKLGTGTYDGGLDLTRIQESPELTAMLKIAGLR